MRNLLSGAFRARFQSALCRYPMRSEHFITGKDASLDVATYLLMPEVRVA